MSLFNACNSLVNIIQNIVQNVPVRLQYYFNKRFGTPCIFHAKFLGTEKISNCLHHFVIHLNGCNKNKITIIVFFYRLNHEKIMFEIKV